MRLNTKIRVLEAILSRGLDVLRIDIELTELIILGSLTSEVNTLGVEVGITILIIGKEVITEEAGLGTLSGPPTSGSSGDRFEDLRVNVLGISNPVVSLLLEQNLDLLSMLLSKVLRASLTIFLTKFV